MSLPKEGAKGGQPNNSVSYVEKRSITRATMKPKKRAERALSPVQRAASSSAEAPYRHSRLNTNMDREFKLAPLPTKPRPRKPDSDTHLTGLPPPPWEATTLVATCNSADDQALWLQTIPLTTKLSADNPADDQVLWLQTIPLTTKLSGYRQPH